MIRFFCLFAILTAICSANIVSAKADSNVDLVSPSFEEYIKSHGLEFYVRNKNVNYNERKAIFNANVLRMNEISKKYGFKAKINKLMHLTDEELKIKFPKEKSIGEMNYVDTVNENMELKSSTVSAGLSSSVDWVAAGAVTKAKDQGSCSSSWSFAATGALEGAYFIKYGRLPGSTGCNGFQGLSEQQLIACGTSNSGCTSGTSAKAFNDVATLNGLQSEYSYPYIMGPSIITPSCSSNGGVNDPNVATDSNNPYYKISKNNVTEIMKAVAKQPVTAIISLDMTKYVGYTGGVLTAPSSVACSDVSHSVLIVGYGSDASGVKYWKVKDSYGSDWGENGFIYISQDTNSDFGLSCSAVYPNLVTSTTPPPSIAPTVSPAPNCVGNIVSYLPDYNNYASNPISIGTMYDTRNIVIISASLHGDSTGYLDKAATIYPALYVFGANYTQQCCSAYAATFISGSWVYVATLSLIAVNTDVYAFNHESWRAKINTNTPMTATYLQSLYNSRNDIANVITDTDIGLGIKNVKYFSVNNYTSIAPTIKTTSSISASYNKKMSPAEAAGTFFFVLAIVLLVGFILYAKKNSRYEKGDDDAGDISAEENISTLEKGKPKKQNATDDEEDDDNL